MWGPEGGEMEGDDVYLHGVFLSSSLCLPLPNRPEFGYPAGTTAALENRYRFPEKKNAIVQFGFV